MTAIEAEIGRRLRLARKAWKLSQAEVAKALHLPRSAVSEMKAGRRGVSGLELHRLAYLYGRDMADFLDEDYEPTAAIAALFRRHANVRLSDCALEPLRRSAALGHETANLERRLGRGRTALPAYSHAPPGSPWEASEQGSAVTTKKLGQRGFNDPRYFAAFSTRCAGLRDRDRREVTSDHGETGCKPSTPDREDD